ncbi:Subtilisin-like protease [Thalictrum thalictroides]|uniref:Subtilisin-like protease n=1 Tax=Thalictrum thalictroides TaxID=46969 RepID=A0A7J6UVA7_THATH|nr:Subtilisin-like protease [Thalictrum thalictroides]
MGINKYSFLVLLVIFVFISLETHTLAAKKPYAVYFGAHLHGPEPTSEDYDRAEANHHRFLASFLGSKEKAKEAMIYSNTKHINAFTAMLEPQEAKQISKDLSVVSFFGCNIVNYQTTRTWEFLGMEKHGEIPPDSLWKKSLGEDIIIANVDSGVDPSSESFNDDGIGPIPSKWKGRCGDNDDDGSSCNRKLLSMRKFYRGYEMVFNKTFDRTSKDKFSHGTHTLSTAGGRFVNVNYTGFSNKIAKGGAPNARVASYKAIFGAGIQACDEIAAIDEAIHDGVDVLSLSLGSNFPMNYTEDGLAISTLHAVKKGIVSVMAAGNGGPNVYPVTNLFPWVITVGASTIDRTFTAYVELGNKQRLKVCMHDDDNGAGQSN